MGVMGGVLGLVAVGGNHIATRYDTAEERAKKKNNDAIAYTCFAMAGALHIWGAVDAKNTVEKQTVSFFITPDRDGANFALSARF
jgi:hypothetical protein